MFANKAKCLSDMSAKALPYRGEAGDAYHIEGVFNGGAVVHGLEEEFFELENH